jgi:hypothetical protein
LLRLTATSTSEQVLLSPEAAAPTFLSLHALCPDHVLVGAERESGSSPSLFLELRAGATGLGTIRSAALENEAEAFAGDDQGAAIILDETLIGIGDQVPIRLPDATGKVGRSSTGIRTANGVVVIGGAAGRVSLVR